MLLLLIKRNKVTPTTINLKLLNLFQFYYFQDSFVHQICYFTNCNFNQSKITFIATGEKVSSIVAYSEGAPVLLV